MGSVYILGKGISDKSVYIFSTVPIENIDLDIAWRYGIFRAQSLTYHAYILGLFNLLIFTIYSYTEKRTKIKFYIPMLSGVIASVSRMAYGGLIFVASIILFRRRKWFISLLLVVLFILVININPGDHPDIKSILNLSELTEAGDLDSETIRLYSRYKSVEIWKDHPVWGVGPGMFGGIVAFKYHSYINELYNLKSGYLGRVQSIEQFWYQILAEIGITGTLCFINLIIILVIVLYKERERADTDEIRNLFSGLIVFIPCILIYSIGSGINIAPVFFTYCAFAGIGLGSLIYQPASKIIK
jgi:O-antigen ligase